ncbi:zinc metalloprotease [Nocardioides terrisoli]|uniref:zinc metalloprotease n=1 Tax=Nocardioides terrisoli TaxID=3388267 RepID=UPI00287B78A7|nr:zinc metalloprotease [Nocardioides marmorisolisilvae]
MTSFALCGVLLVQPSAGATPASATAPAAPCIVSADTHVPAVHRLDDTPRVTGRDLDAVVNSTTGANGRPMLLRLPAKVRIPVYVHVIKGTHKGERVPAGPRKVKRVIRILNGGFHGKQRSRDAHRTRYTFVLRHIDYTKREGWYHAYLFGPRDTRMRKSLHRGGRGDLNLYINGGGPRGNPVLGWSRFPWQYRHHPRLDGVSVNWRALPGGTLRHYDKGDTVIHETGHWMGLFHTFQNGCRRPGDRVADTPYEGVPSYRCERYADTCSKPGNDPIHDFMDYSYDSCMNHFTAGQVARMDRVFAEYRR